MAARIENCLHPSNVVRLGGRALQYQVAWQAHAVMITADAHWRTTMTATTWPSS